MKERARWVVRKFWGSLAISLVLVAVVVQIGRQLAPMVSENHDQFARYLSQQADSNITISGLKADWDGLRPALTMSDFRIHDQSGIEVLHVESAVAQVDLLKSLWGLELSLWRVEMDHVKLTLTQSDKGWDLAGLRGEQVEDDTQADPLGGFLTERYIRLNDINVTFAFESGRRHRSVLTSLLLQNDSDFHRLVADVHSPDGDGRLRLVYEGLGDPRNSDEFEGSGYLKIDRFDLETPAAFWSESLAERLPIQEGMLSSEAWLTFAPNEPLSVIGDLAFERKGKGADEFPQRIQTGIELTFEDANDWQLELREGQAFWAADETQIVNAQINSVSDSWSIRTPVVDVGHWLEQMNRFPQVPATVRRILNELGVKGQLHNVLVDVPREQPIDFQIQANLQDVSVNEWKGAPQIAQLDGYLSAGAFDGFVEIDSAEGFFMHFPKVYKEGFQFDRAQGQVGWSVSAEDNQVYVNSGQLTMSGTLGLVNGYFYLDAPLQRDSRASELVLQIGLQDADALSHNRLVPFVVPDSLVDWLDSSIVGGEVPTGSFVMQSYFGKGASKARSVQVGLNLQSAQLQYDPKWPALRDFDGYIEVDSPLVDGWIDRGAFLDTAMQPSYVRVENHPSGKGSLLSVLAEVDGEASSGLDILTQTPLRDALGDGFDAWLLSGALNARVDLAIPLQAGLDGHRQQVEVQLKDTHLSMQDLNLDFAELNGGLSFNNESGLSAKKLTARLWQQPLAIHIDSRLDDSGSSSQLLTDVGFEGSLDFSELERWSSRPEVNYLQGVSPVKGNVLIGKNLARVDGAPASVLLTLGSDLTGSRVELPSPYGKEVSDSKRLTAEIAVAKSAVSYAFNYDEQVFVSLLQPETGPVRGTVALGEQDTQGDHTGLLIRGDVEQADGQQWWQVIQRYQSLLDQFSSGASAVAIKSNASAKSGVKGTVESSLALDLDIDTLTWGEGVLSNIQISGGQSKDGWRIRLDDDVVSGEIVMKDGQPVEVNADYIRWPAIATATELNNVKAEEPSVELSSRVATELAGEVAPTVRFFDDFSAKDLFAMNANIDELSVGDESYGRWAFELRPTESEIKLQSIVGEIRGVRVAGLSDDDRGGVLTWRQGDKAQQSTTLRVTLRTENLEEVSNAWQLPKMLDSQYARTRLDFTWPGTPEDFALVKTQGDFSLKVKDGRFYRSTGQASNALLRLVGLFNFDSWVRRLKLDFSDVYKGGTPYERIEGSLRIKDAVLYLDEPIEVVNTSSRLQMGGMIDLKDETLDTSLVATLPVGGNATLITALAAGLPAAAGVYAVSKIFKKQVDRVASVSYSIEGSWAQPVVSFDRLFDNKAAKKAAKSSLREHQLVPDQVGVESLLSPDPQSFSPSHGSLSQSKPSTVTLLH